MTCRFVVLMAATLGMAGAADVKVVEEIVAKVNGDIITNGDIEEKRHEIELVLRQQQRLSGVQLERTLAESSKDMLRDKIDELLLVQKAKDNQITADSEVARRIAEMQVLSKISDPEKFHEWVAQETGIPFEEYKQKLTNDYLVHRVVSQEVGARITIPEADLRKYYDDHQGDFVRKEQVFLSQILVSTEGKSADQVAAAEKKAKDIVARARKGEKFSELVAAYSDDVETARTGGQLGPYQRGLMPKEMEDAVFKAKRGDVTDPFKRPQGFVILRVDERWEAGQASFDEVRAQIQEIVAGPQVEARMRPFLQKLRTEAFLEIKDGHTDTGAAPGKDTSWHDVAVLKPLTTTKEEVAASHKRHRHLLFVPIPGTVEARGKRNTPTNTANLGDGREIAPPTQPAGPVVSPPASADNSTGSPAGQSAAAAPGTAAAGAPGPAEVAAASGRETPAELPISKVKKTATKAAPDKPAAGPAALPPIQQ